MTARTCIAPLGGSLEVMPEASLESWVPNARRLPEACHPLGQPDWHSKRIAVLAAFLSNALLTGVLSAATPQGIPDWKVESDQAGAQFGTVSSAGDVNGDGYDDVIVGAATFENGEPNEGAAFVYLGSASGLMTTPSWTAEGNQAGARFGYPVAGAGDVNGDGFDDVIVGAQQYDNGETDEGGAFVFMGSSTGLSSSPIWVTEGNQADAWYGHWVASAGDVNGDSYGDVIVGAPKFTNGEAAEGRAYVYLGSSTGLAATPVWTAESDQAGAWFGECVASAGDVDDDGFSEIIVGSSFFDGGESNEGRAFLYMGSPSGPGTLASWTAEPNVADANYGRSVASAGDVNADGFGDVVVGAVNFANGQTNEGRAFLYLGSALGLATSPVWGFESDQTGAGLGHAVAGAGDVNGDGYDDVVAGAFQFDAGEFDEGRVFLFLGTPAGLMPNPIQVLEPNKANAWFGLYLGAGDVNKDGYSDLVVGARSYSNGETDEGAAFLYLGERSFGDVLYKKRIADGVGGLPSGTLDASDVFAESMTPIGDLNDDGVVDLAVGSAYDDDGGTNRGALYVLFLNRNGTASSFQKISATTGGFGGTLDDVDLFGVSTADLGDLDGDGVTDLAVGALDDDDGGTNRGALWILFLNADGTVKDQQKISSSTGGFGSGLDDNDEFGVSVEGLGDLDGDTVEDLVVGAYHDDDGGANRGAVWILFLNTDGTVRARQKVSDTVGGFTGTLADQDEFGRSVATVGDLNGDGVVDIAVAASQDSQAGTTTGAVWILFLESDGTVSSSTKITEGMGGFSGDLDDLDQIGISLENLGDLGGPGIVDLAAGAYSDDDGATNAGAVWILSLDQMGNVVGQQKISDTSGGFGGDLAASDLFGLSIAALGDLDQDGRNDAAIGALEQVTSSNRGAMWICYLNDGTLNIGANATTWTGATDTQWELASNWSSGVPDDTKTAIIPDATTTPNDPAITVSGQECSSLWIQAGATLDISAGADSLGVFAGATVSGTITGSGQLVFKTASTLAGNGTISLTFSPSVKADEDLLIQGGLLTITGSLEVGTVTFFFNQSGSMVSATGDLDLQGRLKIGESLVVRGTLSSSATSSLEVQGSGACITAGQLDIHHDVNTACTLHVENSTTDSTIFNAVAGWPASVSIDVNGTSTLLTPDLVIEGSLVLVQGRFAIGVSGTITVQSIVVEDGATLDVTGVQTLLKAPATITVESGGKLVIGQGGELLLETGTNTIAIESNGTLRLDGVPSNRAAISGYLGNRYQLSLDTGAHLEAKGFAFRQMEASGIVIGMEVDLAAAPYDLRGGLFDLPAPGGVLLDIQRATPTQLRYLRFDNSMAATGVKNVRTSLASSPITLVNWSGTLSSDAATAETFDDDPGETTPPERIVWAPPQQSVVQGFTASWGPGLVQTSWQTLAEVDSEAFVVQRSPEPPGLFTTAGVKPSVGPSSYVLLDQTAPMFGALRYRLFELLTHGELRLVTEVMLPATGMVLRPVGPTPTPTPPMLTPQLVVVGPSGTYPDVHTALRALQSGRRHEPVTLTLASGRHEAFEIGRGLGFDLCLVAEPGAVIDAAGTPLLIAGLPSDRTVELVGLVIDAGASIEPALVMRNASGVVLLQDVDVRGALALTHASAVAIQGGAIEGELRLERGSRATASSVRLESFELTGSSVLETRGGDGAGPKAMEAGGKGSASSPAIPGKVEPGSRWLAHDAAPRLTLSGGEATLEAGCPGLAWLGMSPRLGFQPRARALLEGVLLLEPSNQASVGGLRPLTGGRASWQLGPVPPGECIRVQGLVFDPATGRICLSDVVRLER